MAVQVTCLVSEGDAPFNLSWTLQGKPLSAVDGINAIRISPKASLLLIDPVNEELSGNYTCAVKNAGGSVRYSAELLVNGNILGLRVNMCIAPG